MKKTLIFILTATVLILSGCKAIKYVPVETVRTDSIYQTKVFRDSILVRDSIYVREKGDTVFEYRYKYIYRDKVATDTLYIEKTDSIQVPYPVEKELTKWQKAKQAAGEVAIVILIVGIVGAGLYFVKRKLLK